MKSHIVALAGNPNSGKTTLFNALTGSRQRVGNWPGVTVERKEGKMNDGTTIIDLPGIYSLSASSEDERVAMEYMMSRQADLLVNIVDATNLERNLYLTTRLLEMRVPTVIALNMMDIAENRGMSLDPHHLETHLGVPVFPVTATDTSLVDDFRSWLAPLLENPPVPRIPDIPYPNEINEQIARWSSVLEPLAKDMGVRTAWIGVRLLDGDPDFIEQSGITPQEIQRTRGEIEKILKEGMDVILADARYGFVHGIAKDVIIKKANRRSRSEGIDNVVMNPILGMPIFLGVMYLVFWFTINVGGAFIDFFDILFRTVFVDGFGRLLISVGVPLWAKTILADGIGAGIQTVATFVPVIFTMFFALSILEDSGYMARAAFVMDRAMRAIGLPGKAFVPLIVGFGCTVPAILATRTLDNRRDRFLTIFMSPLMSCGARLPVYALFASAFFTRYAGMVVFSLYLLGIILAVGTGLLLKNTLFKGDATHFIMELPPYHSPRLGHIFRHTWIRLKDFISRAGKVIIIAVLLLGLLASVGIDGSFGNQDGENSALSAIGRGITPIFTPFGIQPDNWPASVGLFTGLFAKEAIVGTLNSLYSIEAGGSKTEDSFSLAAGVVEAFTSIVNNLKGAFATLFDPLGLGIVSADEREILNETGVTGHSFEALKEAFSPASAYAYLIFVLTYVPCLAAAGAAVKEMGWRYAFIQFAYLTILGFSLATLFYQTVAGGSVPWIFGSLAILSGLIITFVLLGRRSAESTIHSYHD